MTAKGQDRYLFIEGLISKKHDCETWANSLVLIIFIDEEVFHASLKLLANKKTVSKNITQDNRPNRHGLLK